MKMTELTTVAAQYHPLLTRYAGYIIKNKDAGEKIALAVFEELFETNINLSDDAQRLWLKSRVERRCREWLRNEVMNNIKRVHAALSA